MFSHDSKAKDHRARRPSCSAPTLILSPVALAQETTLRVWLSCSRQCALIKAGPLLARDLIVLFDDGEENGFHGSRLFVDEHPWAKEIGLVLNFDARGNSGPSIMFETSEDNGWLIRQYAQAIPQPLATSLSMDVYRIMPNDTDLTVFKQAGMGGLNFAFGAGLAYYHTPEDTPENLDPRTLQHQGENALAAVRRFGQLDLDDTRQENVVYTSILSRMVMSYSTKWVPPLAFVAGLFCTWPWSSSACLASACSLLT